MGNFFVPYAGLCWKENIFRCHQVSQRNREYVVGLLVSRRCNIVEDKNQDDRRSFAHRNYPSETGNIDKMSYVFYADSHLQIKSSTVHGNGAVVILILFAEFCRNKRPAKKRNREY